MNKKTLYYALGKSNNINTISVDSFEEAITIAYQNKNYSVFQNSELLDVKNRFRIFNYNNTNYLIKSIRKEKANSEISNSLHASKLLNGKKINNYQLEVIDPKLYDINGKYYVVTEYKGNTLQECLYSNSKSDFSIDDFKKMLYLLSEIGIEYHGFCPRNMVISKKENKIFLFDFEDAIFNEKIDYYNMIYRTNLFVNWSYLYEMDEIKKILDNAQSNVGEEPLLNSYEKCYKEILGFKDNDYKLRENIMNTILIGEKKIDNPSNTFCILPIDMASIISDLFNRNIDVLMDMIFYYIRLKNDKLYQKILRLFNKTIIHAYKNDIELRKSIIPVLIYSINMVEDDIDTDFKLSEFSEIKKVKFNNILKKVFTTIYTDYKDNKNIKKEIYEYLFK